MQLLHTSHISKHIGVDIQLLLEENKFSAELLPVLEIIKAMLPAEPMPFSREWSDDLIKNWNRQLSKRVPTSPLHLEHFAGEWKQGVHTLQGRFFITFVIAKRL